jgi:hypothetical protein
VRDFQRVAQEFTCTRLRESPDVCNDICVTQKDETPDAANAEGSEGSDTRVRALMRETIVTGFFPFIQYFAIGSDSLRLTRITAAGRRHASKLIRATAAPIADPACEARECAFDPSHDAKPVSTGGKIEYRVSTS